MRQIRSLMVDMEATAVSKDEFVALKGLLFDSAGNLIENWLTIVDQFSSTGRFFLAKQGMELMLIVSRVYEYYIYNIYIYIYIYIFDICYLTNQLSI